MLYNVWDDDWLDIIRDVIYPDKIQREQMLIPEEANILDFINKYFILAGTTTSELLTNQNVRVVYGFYPEDSTDIPNGHIMKLSFDIFVKTERQHDVCNDRLVFRTQRIARRLMELLYIAPREYNDGFVGVFHLRDPHEAVLGTRTIGYERHNLTFTFTKIT